MLEMLPPPPLWVRPQLIQAGVELLGDVEARGSKLVEILNY